MSATMGKPVAVCNACGFEDSREGAVGRWCEQAGCAGLMVAPLPPAPADAPAAPPPRDPMAPRASRDRGRVTRPVGIAVVVVLLLALLADRALTPDGEPVSPEPTATAAGTVTPEPMTGETMDEKPGQDDRMAMPDSGATKDHTRTLRQSAHQFVTGYLAWSYGVWRSPPGLFAAGERGAAYVQIDRASGWAGEPDERPEIAEFETQRKGKDRASAHAVAGVHVLDLVLQRHTTGSMKNWLGIEVTHHMRPIWRVTTVAEARGSR